MSDPYNDYFGRPRAVCRLVRVKRVHVPCWLWNVLGRLVLRQPLRWLLTRAPSV